MQKPSFDLAIFSIYSFYDKKSIDQFIEVYFGIMDVIKQPVLKSIVMLLQAIYFGLTGVNMSAIWMSNWMAQASTVLIC